MGNYIDEKIPQRVSRQFRRVLIGRTDITPMANGEEDRNARWKFKKLRFEAQFALLDPKAQEALTSVFYAANARLYLFRFRDPGDYTVDRSPLAVTAGTKTPVQLTKRYTFGSVNVDRRIQAVSTCTVYDKDGVEVDGTLDNVLGLFTPTNDWGSGQHTWSGRFDVWVRFEDDELDMTLITHDIGTSKVVLCEQRARR